MRKLKDRGRSEPGARSAHNVVAETLNHFGKQLSIVAGADQGCAMAIWKKTPQHEWKNQQPIVPERADMTFHHGLADDISAIVHFISQRALP